MESAEVNEIFKSLGADLCGIACMDRFNNAPKGYHPSEVLPTCKSVISFGCRFPAGTLACRSSAPYTRVRNTITPKMDAGAFDI
jgi:epoxyqueuosine reductase